MNEHETDSDRLIRIETKLDEVLTPLQATVTANSARIGALESFRGYVQGVAAAIVFILTLIGVGKLLPK